MKQVIIKNLGNKIKQLKNPEIYKNKIKTFVIEVLTLKYENDPQKFPNETKKWNKVEIYDMNLHEIRTKVLKDIKDVFDKVGSMIIGLNNGKTHVRFESITDC